MRAHRHAELRRQQEDRQDLVEPTETAGVELAEADGFRLEQLLEDDAVLAVLAGGDLNWRDRARDRGMAQHVVGAGRLLDPVRIELGEQLHVGDGVAHLPDLVRVHHQAAVRADLLAHDPGPAHVVLDLLADLHLHVGPAGGDGLAA